MMTSLGKTATLVSEKGIPQVVYAVESEGATFSLSAKDLSGRDHTGRILMSGSEADCLVALQDLTKSLRSKDERDTVYRRVARCAATGLGGFLALALLATIARPHAVSYPDPSDAMKMQQMQQMMMQDGLQGLGGMGGADLPHHAPAQKMPPAAPKGSTLTPPSPSLAKTTGKVFTFDSMTPMPKAVAYAQDEDSDTDPVVQTDQYGIPTMQGRSVLNKQANEPDNKSAVFSMIGSDYDNTDDLKGVFKDLSAPQKP